MTVAVLGASDRPDRYGYKALKLLEEKGYRAFPVHPRLETIEGTPVYPSLADVPEPIDTVTVYLSARNSDRVADDLLASGARRVIFPPGAENPDLEQRLQTEGIEVLEACPLVMLRTGQF
ncbi:MAG: CoA-binding protein [Planctomycetota bacterium]